MAYKNLVAIVVDKESIIKAIHGEVSNYVVKPFSPAVFTERLAMIIPQGQ